MPTALRSTALGLREIEMNAKRSWAPLLKAVAVSSALWLAACAKEPASAPPAAALDEPANELRWARAALERNPELKIVSVDSERNSIKILIKASGETATVTPGELAAIPIGDLVALSNAVAAARAAAESPKVVEEPIPSPAPTAQETERAATTDYKVEHQDGRMRISGPGMSVEASQPAQSSQSTAQIRYDEPIICEGPRMLHLDRRNLNVDGDAIIVRGGCELHLTNSQIAATGTAIVIQDATVHVGNSTVRGGDASFDAGPSAKLFMQNTRFAGTSRRDSQSSINDQGGNVWR
jgi:hypothetical protein